MPKLIEKLDAEQSELTEKMASADFYQQEKGVVAAATQRLSEIESELTKAYKKWEELEAE